MIIQAMGLERKLKPYKILFPRECLHYSLKQIFGLKTVKLCCENVQKEHNCNAPGISCHFDMAGR